MHACVCVCERERWAVPRLQGQGLSPPRGGSPPLLPPRVGRRPEGTCASGALKMLGESFLDL